MDEHRPVIAALARAVQSVLENGAGLEVSAKLKRDQSLAVTSAVLQVAWGDHAASAVVRADSEGAQIAGELYAAILDKMGGGKISLQGVAPPRTTGPHHGRPFPCDGCGILMLCGNPTPDGIRCGQCYPGDERGENYLKLIWREQRGMPSGKLRHALYFAGAKRALLDPHEYNPDDDPARGFTMFYGKVYRHCATLEEAKEAAETQVRCDADLPAVPGAENDGPPSAACRDCSECSGVRHHALPPDFTEQNEWFVPCKHCDVRGEYCHTCNEDDTGTFEEIEGCARCGGIGVVWAEPSESEET